MVREPTAMSRKTSPNRRLELREYQAGEILVHDTRVHPARKEGDVDCTGERTWSVSKYTTLLQLIRQVSFYPDNPVQAAEGRPEREFVNYA